jgi:uncharacterized protein
MQEINEIRKILASRPDVIFSYVFGSRVKGYANERSDWDFAIYFEQASEEESDWRSFELEAELSEILKCDAQVVVLNTIDSPVLGFEIINDGKLVTDTNPPLRFAFENNILRRYHDWQHFLRRHMDAEGIRHSSNG